jgi:formamidopyrimidine-DNA glycosylase
VPEILEVESYRALAENVVGARIVRGWADSFAAKKLTSTGFWARAVKGRTIEGTDRRGKLMLLNTDGPTLGMRFGMTGVLLLDSERGIEGLFYGPHTFRREWIRAGLEFADGRTLLLHDPRRLGRVEVEPDIGELGPDALTLTRREFSHVMNSVRPPGPAVKAYLLDQSRFAGVGNLLGDEMLFRAGINPTRSVGSLRPDERDRLFTAWKATMKTLQKRGGSHTGDHMQGRTPGGVCPRDGAPMRNATVGGRTTYWCSSHQK